MPFQEESDLAYSQLTAAEILLIQTCRDLNARFTNHEILFDHIVSFLKSIENTETLIKLANVYAPLEKWCCAPEMEEYWNERWAMLSRFPTWLKAQEDAQLTYRPLMPQARIESFNLVRGMWFYDQANCLALDDFHHPKVGALLDSAAKYHCFEAIRARSKLEFDKFKEGSNNNPEKIIENILPSAQYHGTPIYLLLALRCLGIGLYYDNQNEEDDDPVAQSYFLRALIYLETAELLFNQASAAIHNAYYGQGLIASNPYGLKDFDAWREAIKHYIDSTTFSMSAKTIKEYAKLQAEIFTTVDELTTKNILSAASLNF